MLVRRFTSEANYQVKPESQVQPNMERRFDNQEGDEYDPEKHPVFTHVGVDISPGD